MKTVQAPRIVVGTIEDKLVKELERLKQKLGLGYELSVVWLPDSHNKLSGEVKGDQIRIYEADEQKALETLKHEFLDYIISKTLEPYERIANKLIQLTNEEAYKRKEKLVEVLTKLI